MSDPDHEKFMGLAIARAREGGAGGDIAVGSVVVRDGAVVGAGHNTVASAHDPTNHAEVAAIRDACGNIGSADLSGTTLYTAMEPCPMCLWAICAAGIDRLVLGARHATFIRPEMGDYSVERLLALTGHDLAVVTGVLEGECEGLRPELTRR